MKYKQTFAFLLVTSQCFAFELSLDANPALTVNSLFSIQAAICSIVINSPDNDLSCTPDDPPPLTPSCQPLVNIDGKILVIDDSIVFSDKNIQIISTTAQSCLDPINPANENGLTLQIGTELWDLSDMTFNIEMGGIPTILLHTASETPDCSHAIDDVVWLEQFE